jgi:hypothetical protein
LTVLTATRSLPGSFGRTIMIRRTIGPLVRPNVDRLPDGHTHRIGRG